MATPKETRTVDIIVNGQQANASLKEMDAAAAVLYAQFRKLSADDPGRAKILADYQAMKARIADVKTELVGVTETTGVMKQAFANAFAIFTGGGLLGLAQKLFGFFADSREEALASAKSSADLEQTLRSTAHAAGLTAEEIRKIGTERAKVTLFDDDETNQASALLLTFTNIKKGVFEEAMPAIQDLATKMGGDGPADMKGAAIQVGKALNDPIKGITALTRVGVSFTDQQKAQITAMVKAGDAAGAQKLILAELNKEFGGSAEAARKAAGGVATLSMWFNEFKETVGGQVNKVLDAMSQWLGRVIDKSQPLVDIVMELVDMYAEFYHEIGDILVSLGLFNEKTDTAAFFVEVLKTALTLLLIPIKAGVLAAKGLVDVFIDWYNKSELLRGVLGGLGAVIVSVFTTIKDNAIKILGGVADIIVGIFSLDKNKIIAGFKSALSATADVMLEGGNKAAEAFKKGFEANKNNHIVRTKIQVTKEEETTEKLGPLKADAPAGESEKDKKARLDKAKKLQDAADQARLDALKELVKKEEALEDARIKSIADKREREIAKTMLDADREIRLVTGSKREQAEQIAGIVAERDRKLQELAEKAQKEADDRRKADFERDMAEEEAAEQERANAFTQRFQDGLDSEARYHEKMYDSKRLALQAELELEQAYAGKTSKQYTKTAAELLKLEKDYNKQKVDDAKKAQHAKAEIAKLELSTASDVLGVTLDLLFQDEAARKKNHDVYVALAAAKIIVDGTKEVQAIWQYSAEQPENSITAGVFGTVLAGIQTGLAVARTAAALGKLGAGGGSNDGSGGSYWAGGATGDGSGLAMSPMGQLMQASGMSIGANGRLQDGSGFAVAGIVHEDEYVVPKWMRADPQVAAVEQWLEARRLRGFADGGATSPGPTLPVPAASPNTDGEKTYAVLVQMLAVNQAQAEQLADVKAWQQSLQVNLNLRDTQSKLGELKQVQQAAAIRSKK